ncbi:MAG: insulinase family protein [Bauldia sp.]|uniref:M16 family metallopeptidase n=1 Tax=Bauldia sp. TaxID=2575872 RepID=UPI001E05F943|nr:pitrilysin family protein [Bauldia sp.]MCB1497770.1 insulinase family protein [Bauldia sp.]
MKLAKATFAICLLLAPALFPAAANAVTIERVVSPKGIVAWLVQEDAIPLIAMSFAFEGGSAQDPADKPGVANLLSGLLDEGAGPLDSKAFQKALEDDSISMSFDVGRDTFEGSLRTLVENRDEAAHLLKLALTEPRFDPEPVERIRAQILTGLKADQTDPGDLASRALMASLFPGHPYGRPSDGTIDSVASITREDLQDYFNKIVAKDNLAIAVVGAIDPGELATLLDEVFGDLPVKANRAGVAEAAPQAGGDTTIPMAIPQTVIQIAGKGLKRDDPDFIAASVAAYILGGGSFSSRLYEEVREKRGLAYSVYLGLVPLDHAGLVYVGTSTRADQADTVVDLIEREIRKFAEEGPTEKELADAKDYLIGSYPLRFDTSQAIASQLLAIQLEGLGIDYINKRNDMIAAVTIEDVRKAAARLFTDDMTIVRVGQPAT